jgi:cytochrome c oxidase subunit 4
MKEEALVDNRHIVPLRTYLAVGGALLILTAVTVGVSFLPLGGWNAIVALGLASLKATLVALFFMHLLYDKKIFMVVFVVSIMMLGIFIGLTMFDTLRRGDVNSISAQPIEKNAAMYNKPVEEVEESGMPVKAEDSVGAKSETDH